MLLLVGFAGSNMREDAPETISTTIFTTLKNNMLLISPIISMNAMQAMSLLYLFSLEVVSSGERLGCVSAPVQERGLFDFSSLDPYT